MISWAIPAIVHCFKKAHFVWGVVMSIGNSSGTTGSLGAFGAPKTEQETPDFGAVDTEPVREKNARSSLKKIASDPSSAAVKTQLAQEGVSLTDESDVGPGKRFGSLEEKAYYVGTRYAYSIKTIFPSIVAYGWGFVDPGDVMVQGFEQQFNTPASRDALRVDVPIAHGGTSSSKISVSDMTVEQWLDLAKGVVESVEFENPAKYGASPT